MRFISYLVSLSLIGLCSTRAMGQTVEPEQKDGTPKESAIWKGSFADGTPLTQKRLEELLALHRVWSQNAYEKLRDEWGKAKVKGQDRETWTRALLASDWEADQGRLVLKGVHLSYANLEGADLWNASLEGADLEKANLKRAKLRNVNLKGADLWNAKLEGAYLWNANLQGANLRNAKLKGAKLKDANLKGAKLVEAKLQGALYEPKWGRLPEIVSLRTAENLEMMRFCNSPHALEDLRQKFKKVGFKEQERQITYAIKRSEQINAQACGDFIESFFNYIFFSIYPWPTAYVQDGRYGFLFR